MNPLEKAGYNRLESKDLKEWWSRWNENGSCDQIQIRKGGSLMLDIQPEELKLVSDYVNKLINQNQSVFDSVQDKVHAQKMLNSTFGMNTTDLLKTLKIRKDEKVEKGTDRSDMVEEQGDRLLGDYHITDKGELALKDKEIADLTRTLERLHDENQENKDGFTYWFEKHNEVEEERNELQKSLEAKDVQITALSKEIKYLTNGCELLAKDLKVTKLLIAAMKNVLEGKA